MEDPESDPYLLVLNFLLNIRPDAFSIDLLISILVVIVLLLFSAMISGAEVAYFSLKPIDLNDIRMKANLKSQLILAHLERPKRLLATILITNNFVNVGIVILSAFISETIFDFSNYEVLGFVIEVLVITSLILLMGEIMPKIFANQRPVTFAQFMAQPLKILISIFYPMATLLVRTTTFIDKKVASQGQEISLSELSHAIDITSDEHTTEEETKILKGIVKFTDIEVKEIMKSRLDVAAFDTSIGFKEVLENIRDLGYSRIPVFTDTFDKVDGILYVKDLLPYLNEKDDFKWQKLLRSASFVPENKKINDLLQEIQENKTHIAIVVDEYGGTSGIVTLEDIIEEIVGEIADEFDTPEDEIGYSKIDERNYIFEGKTSINDFCKIIKQEGEIFEEVKGDADSLAGLILEITGRIPERNVVVNFKNYEFKILTVDNRRIKMINVTINDPVEE